MTQNGTLFQLVPLVHRTAEIVSGLWPTPDASMGTGGRVTNPEHVSDTGLDFRTGKKRTITLADSVRRSMWPTPSASQMPCEGTVRLCRQRWLAGDVTLEEASAIAGRDVRKSQGKVPAMLPTPTCEDAKNNGNQSRANRNSLPLNGVAGGKLNPQWVEWLMGFPIGWTDLDA
tara:strand:+ start:469 stop:987 length:519 start_codon:yes stop_codon:yes gene_type:complete